MPKQRLLPREKSECFLQIFHHFHTEQYIAIALAMKVLWEMQLKRKKMYFFRIKYKPGSTAWISACARISIRSTWCFLAVFKITAISSSLLVDFINKTSKSNYLHQSTINAQSIYQCCTFEKLINRMASIHKIAIIKYDVSDSFSHTFANEFCKIIIS